MQKREWDYRKDEEERERLVNAYSAGAAAQNGSSRGVDDVEAQRVGKDTEDVIELQKMTGEKPQRLEVVPERLTGAERSKKPLWQVWPTRSKFFCNGFCMTGGETELGITSFWSVPNLCVWTCIMAPCSVYFGWVFPTLLQEGSYALPLATLAVFFLATGFLLATCCSDPGVLPRREVILATRSGDTLEHALGYDPLAKSYCGPDGKIPRGVLPVELSSLGYRWCRTCRIVRPPRASHCPDCDNCVLRYDHHCPFVNNCVGQRNYHFFFGFVTSVVCLALLVLPVLFSFMNSDNFEGTLQAMTHLSSGALQPFFLALIACGALVGMATLLGLLLWLYHVFLISTNSTTKEYRKSLKNVTEEPTLCGSRGRRLFDPYFLVDPMEMIRADEAPQEPPANFCSACLGDSD
mmetsp:Transcript_66594/g.124273  ORF Transcript_66594/g.124273 Transcript_66594/m.124273 type:complete len:407 (-) Transcript_66594:53-1273(-)